MATSKAHRFGHPLFEISQSLKTLSHPARIKILLILLVHGVTPFTILSKKIPLAKETSSQHLRALREKGLISLDEKYPHSYYSLEPSSLRKLLAQLRSLIDMLEENLDRSA